MSDWIEWKGGECPVVGTTDVHVRMRSDGEIPTGASAVSCPACILDWHRGPTPRDSDIIAYRVVSP